MLWNGCLNVGDWRLGRCSSIVIRMAVSANRAGNASSRWRLEGRNRTKPYVISHSFVPVTTQGTLFARRVLALGVTILGLHGFLHCNVDFQDGRAVKTVLKKTRSERRREVNTVER